MVVSREFILIHNQMKKISKLKLTQLSKVELESKKMNALKGGKGWCVCTWCGCPGTEEVLKYIDDGATDIVGEYTQLFETQY